MVLLLTMHSPYDPHIYINIFIASVEPKPNDKCHFLAAAPHSTTLHNFFFILPIP